MPKDTEKDSVTLAEQIRQRRIELGLSISEAASIAAVARGTWSRYEAGMSIREEKKQVFARH